MTTSPNNRRRHAFTLVELLVSIAILALLIGLVVKGVSKFRKAAWGADTQNTLRTIENAIQSYYADFHAYPGVLPNSALGVAATTIKVKMPAAGYANPGTGTNLDKVTGTENLVLSLFGGLYYDSVANAVTYDPTRVGTGAGSLNPGNPKKSPAYLSETKLLNEGWQSTTKDGHYKDDAGEADDSIVPDLVDRFPQPMPILYLRASTGYEVPAGTTATIALNNIITKGAFAATGTIAGQYQLEQVIGYTGAYSGNFPALTADSGALPPAAGARSIGESKSINKGSQYANAGSPIAAPAAPYHGLRTITGVDLAASSTAATMTKGDPKFQYPYDAYAYLRDPTLSTGTTPAARQKDHYILISAGPDRIYGTEDDITSFGSVGGD